MADPSLPGAKVSRRLAAVISADVVGYSRLVEHDEEGTIYRLRAYWDDLVRPAVDVHGGRIVKLMGDGALMEFPSVLEAVRCALAVQRHAAELEASVPEALRIRYRVGIHLGDIVIDGDDIQGHGVNVASRLQSLADAGGICISEAVRSALGRRSLPLALADLGEQAVKNIAEPIRAYRVLDGDVSAQPATGWKRSRAGWKVWATLIGLLAVAGLAAVYLQRDRLMPGRTTLAAVPSIAVLPFVNLSDDAKQEFFVDGLTEDLITDLSKLPGLFVISRNSAFTYKGQAVRARQVADELGVKYVLNGSVRRSADRIRFNAQLIDATEDRQLWAERYDCELSDIFTVQDEVKQQIVDALALKLGPGDRERLSTAPTENIEAYEYYLRGRHAMNERVRRSLRTAYFALEKAIALDPIFAEAYALLAMTYAIDVTGTGSWDDWVSPPGRAQAQARILAQKASALKPELAMPELVFASLSLADRDYDEAIRHAERAVELEPGNAEAYAVQAFVLTAAGRHQEALTAIEEAFRRDPKGPPYFYVTRGIVHFALREYEKALGSLQTSHRAMVGGGDWFHLVFLAASYAHVSKQKELRALLDSVYGTGESGINITGVRFSQFYRHAEDNEHLLEGLTLGGMDTYALGFTPEKDAGARISAKALERLMLGHSFDAFCISPRAEAKFRFAHDGRTTWTVRHDITASGSSRIADGKLCVAIPDITRGREACFEVYEANPKSKFSRGHAYVLAGPSVCYFSPAP